MLLSEEAVKRIRAYIIKHGKEPEEVLRSVCDREYTLQTFQVPIVYDPQSGWCYGPKKFPACANGDCLLVALIREVEPERAVDPRSTSHELANIIMPEGFADRLELGRELSWLIEGFDWNHLPTPADRRRQFYLPEHD